MDTLKRLGKLIWLPFLLMTACNEDTAPKTPAAPVKIQIVQPDTITHDFVFSGALEAAETYQLAFMVPGEVTSVGVSEGQEVSKGQTLATLGSHEYRQA